jgi:hypothetical protein
MIAIRLHAPATDSKLPAQHCGLSLSYRFAAAAALMGKWLADRKDSTPDAQLP